MVAFGAFLSLTDSQGWDHATVFAAARDYVRLAEGLGMDSVWINEHHFMGFSIDPDTLTMAGYLLGMTERLRVGTAVSLLPFQHAVSVAERTALLDQLSGGRLDLGLGRGGYPLDAAVFGIDMADLNAAMNEGIEIVHDALTNEYVGREDGLRPFPPVSIRPRPVSRPHPPLYVAGSSDETLRIAAARGLPLLLSWHQTFDERAEVVRRYADTCREVGGPDPHPPHVGSACVHIGPDTDLAVAELEPRFRAWLASGRAGAFDPAAADSSARFGGVLTDMQTFAARKADGEGAAVARLMGNNPIGCLADVIDWFRRDMAATGTQRYAVFFDVIGDRQRASLNLQRLMGEVAPVLSAASSERVHG